MEFPLPVVDPRNEAEVLEVCSKSCGAKCCKLVGRKFKVPVSMSEFKTLHENNLSDGIDWSGMYPSLDTDHGSCIFLDRYNKCSIHEIRPQACKNYPFDHREEIEEFCQLYHNSPEKYRGSSKPKTLQSTSQHLFDLSDDDKFYEIYLKMLEKSSGDSDR